MEFEFNIKDNNYKLSLDQKDNKLILHTNNGTVDIDYQILSENCLSLIINNESYTIFVAQYDNKWHIIIRDEEYIIEPSSTARKKSYATELTEFADNIITAPMPGKILKIKVNAGDRVTKKQSLIIVEAMKMEHDIRAPFDAIVTKINFSEGQIVDTQSPIIELEKLTD
jgi:biotin carboxyl carrier protein